MSLINKYVKAAYKKLKHNAYYDKTMGVLRAQIAVFENKDFESELDEISEILERRTDDWAIFEDEILKSIEVLVMPKNTSSIIDKNFISNYTTDYNVNINELQFFIKMDIRGHILGVLWILMIGKYLDNSFKMYEKSYGNRLSKKLFKEGDVSYYPCLFETYFSQYEKWRDTGLDIAKKHVAKGDNVIILSLDFSRFYYSVNYSETDFNNILSNCVDNGDQYKAVYEKLHRFVFRVIEKYSQAFNRFYCKKCSNNVLPIGFLPSNILANFKLNGFDKHINDRWNPLYYGRYVDDIIIVDRIDKYSVLYDKIFNNESRPSINEVIKLYMSNCNASKCQACADENGRSLLLVDETSSDMRFYVNPRIVQFGLDSDNQKIDASVESDSRIFIQGKKIKLFAFKENDSDAMLKCFKQEIARTSSEFRCWPDVDDETALHDLVSFFHLSYGGSINKLNSIESVSVNAFELSKILGKQMIMSSLVDMNRGISHDDLIKILSPCVLIKYYTTWERIFEILILHKSYGDIEMIADKILNSIDNLSFIKTDDVFGELSEYDNCSAAIKVSLIDYFISGLSRSLALSWTEQSKILIKQISEKIAKLNMDSYDSHWNNIADYIELMRRGYLFSRMVNKYIIPISCNIINVAGIVHMEDVDLFNFRDVCRVIYSNHDSNDGQSYEYYYKYSPTVLTPQEINYSIRTMDLIYGYYKREDIILQNIATLYGLVNFDRREKTQNNLNEVSILSPIGTGENEWMFAPCIHVENRYEKQQAKLKVAVANAKVHESDFREILHNQSNHSFSRYSEVQKILKVAVEERVDLLVLPECYMPYEWLYRLANWSSKNQIAVVTGVEHFITFGDIDDFISPQNNCVAHNMTAVIMPYKVEDYRYSYIVLQHKRYPSPKEKDLLDNYGYVFYEPSKSVPSINQKQKQFWQQYSFLFYWHSVYFTVHNCFELASYKLRMQHAEYVDLVIAVEWNKDIEYYSNIINSLCRDFHCFCIQVNSSTYGDSRVLQPTKSAFKNLIQTKGGDNFTALTTTIDVEELRLFQLQDHSGSSNYCGFKPFPPGFNHYNVALKIKDQLIARKFKKVSDLSRTNQKGDVEI